MNQLTAALSRSPVPSLMQASGEQAIWRCLEFFTAQIRNPHIRRAYGRAVDGFLSFCSQTGVGYTGGVRACVRQAILPIVRTSRSGVVFGLFLCRVECIISVSSTQLNEEQGGTL